MIVRPMLAVILACLGQWHMARAADAFWRAATPEELSFSEQILSEKNEKGIITREFYYVSELIQGQPCRIYAIYSAPMGAKNVPAVLFIHGGMATSDRSATQFWAERGYACLSFDWTGMPAGTKLKRQYYSEFPGSSERTYNQMFFTPSLDESRCRQALIAARRGLSWLASQPQINSQQLAVEGVSWGGFYSLILGAVDSRPRAIADVYGAGFYQDFDVNHGCFGLTGPLQFLPAESQKAWLNQFDPQHYVDQIKAPTLMMTGTNDMFFWLPLAARTYHALGVEKRLWLEPNINHTLDMTRVHTAAKAWFDVQLKGMEQQFPKLEQATCQNRQVTFSVSSKGSAIAKAQVNYLWLAKRPNGSSISAYTSKTANWQSLDATPGEGGLWRATLPEAPADMAVVALYPTVVTRSGIKVSGELSEVETTPVHHNP